MGLLIAILLIAFLLLVLLFTVALKIIFEFNSDNSNMNLTLIWLYPILRAVVTNEDNRLILTVYFFNKPMLRRPVESKNRKSSNLELIKRINPRDVNVNAFYGFRDPSITGVACGAINAASQFINIDSIHQNPNFVSDNDYIYLDATAKVNLGSALVNIIK